MESSEERAKCGGAISRRGVPSVLFALLALTLLAPAGARAVTWHVANNGLDSNACTNAAPCRSITQAVFVAADDDIILVRPGIYGDIDGDGLFVSPGDEVPTLVHPDCVIDVNKKVRIRSTGSRTTPTVITAGGADMFIVCIHSAGARLRGFTLTRNGPTKPAVVIQPALVNVRLERNLATGTGAGFSVDRAHHSVRHNRALATAGTGFMVGWGEYNQLLRNVSMDNEHIGFYTSALVVPFTTLQGNVAGGNKQAGFYVDGGSDNLRFRFNHAIGNRQHGMLVQPSTSVAPLSNNNFYGNGTQNSLSPANCGLFNDSSASLGAASNYWGAAAGPGTDPADDVCNGIGASTTVAPPLAAQGPMPLVAIQ